MPRRKILVVEDDKSMQRFYCSFFRVEHNAEFSLLIQPTGAGALSLVARQAVDCVLLAWTLPGMQGLEVLRRLRAAATTRFLPVIMVTSRNASGAHVAALEAGADDYVSKEHIDDELLAHLHCIFRKFGEHSNGRVPTQTEGLKLHPNGCLAGEKKVSLFPKERDLLEIFLRRPNIIHSAPYLWEAVWGYRSPSWRETLQVTMSSLRRKLGVPWSHRIETRRAEGYFLDLDSPIL